MIFQGSGVFAVKRSLAAWDGWVAIHENRNPFDQAKEVGQKCKQILTVAWYNLRKLNLLACKLPKWFQDFRRSERLFKAAQGCSRLFKIPSWAGYRWHRSHWKCFAWPCEGSVEAKANLWPMHAMQTEGVLNRSYRCTKFTGVTCLAASPL